METMLTVLTESEWSAGTRCAEWTVQDVVSHLVGVSAFWQLSVASGAAGKPTRFLAGFDPEATPKAMVASMTSLSNREVLAQFIASNDSLIDVLTAFGPDDWSSLAESPPGHVPIQIVAPHALWDAWTHERDIALPLGLACSLEDDEVATCLMYAASLSAAFLSTTDPSFAGRFAIEATDPDVSVTIHVSDRVVVEHGHDGATPLLAGRTVDLIESLSIRSPLPANTPEPWQRLVTGLGTVFTAADV